jgi:hypothetical protein
VGQTLAGQLADPGQELDRPRQGTAWAGAAAGAIRRGRPATGDPQAKGAWYRGWRLLALDGTTLDVADTPANVAAFGRPGGGQGPGAFPQVRLVGLVECGTHAVVDAAMGGPHLGEGTLAPSLGRSLGPGMLLLVDQGLCSLELWRTFQATGTELVWRWPPGRQAEGAGGLRRRILGKRVGRPPPQAQAGGGAGGGLPAGRSWPPW